MTDVDVAALRREHVADQLGLCVDCAQSWPCTTAALLARLEAAEAVVTQYRTGTQATLTDALAAYDRVATGGAHG